MKQWIIYKKKIDSVGSSVLPPKELLIAEYRQHATEYDALNSQGQLAEWMTKADSQALRWHRDEMNKLSAVLDALYPDWNN